MSLKDRLRTARQRAKVTQTAVAKRFGVTPQAVSQWERGESVPESDKFAPLADFLGVDLHWLMSAEGGELVAAAVATAPLEGTRPAPEFLGERDFPVFASAEGGGGTMVVSTDPLELVPRPWFMRDVKDGYAVLIVGESMVPVFEPGDIAIINPRLPAMRERDMIFVSSEDQGEFTATIKRLSRWSASDWHVRQFNPPRGKKPEFVLPRREWPKALRVVGKYYGG